LGEEMTNEDFEFAFANSSSLNAFRAFYPDAEACYIDYARRTSEKFSVSTSNCECCGSSDRVSRRLAKWEIRYQNKKSNRRNLFGLLLLLIGQVHLSRAILRFTTGHSICKKCSSSFVVKRMVTIPASFLATLASYVPVVITVLGVFYLIIESGAIPRPSLVAWCVVIISAAAIPFLFWIGRQADLLTIPAFLRPIAKNPIIFRGLTTRN